MDAPLYKILIVDDEPFVQVFISQVLALKECYEIVTASSGHEALEKLEEFNPDIILLDIEMDGMDGYTVCQRIRDNEKFRFTKIIMVSGHSHIDERRRGYEVGADDYITKPFDEQEFLAKIEVYSRLKHQEEIDQVKSDLLTLLTHETMTPINGIMGCSEILLADASLAEGHRELVSMIVAEGAQLNRFLQNAILLSKLKAGLALTMSREPVMALVENVVTECTIGYEDKKIQVSLSGNKHLQFEADWPLLRFALVSIIGNAVKFSPHEGDVKIKVNEENGVCQVIIDDQGSGLEQNQKKHIFDEFSVADITHHTRGQGLSMSISHRICQRHGGDIEVMDNPSGIGSRFIMTIPCR